VYVANALSHADRGHRVGDVRLRLPFRAVLAGLTDDRHVPLVGLTSQALASVVSSALLR
jgi:hypothetical protein